MRSIMADYAILEAVAEFLENMRSFGITYFGPF